MNLVCTRNIFHDEFSLNAEQKISVQCFFCVSNGRSSSTRRAHSPPRGKPFNKNKGGEGAGGGGVWINQIHVTTMALDSSGLLFFLKWRNHSWKFRSLNTHTHKKKTQRQRRSARSKAMNYFRRKDPISGLSPHQDPRSAFRRRRNKGGDQSRLFLENGKQTEPQLMSTVSN